MAQEKEEKIFCSCIWETVSKNHCEKCKRENKSKNCVYENTLKEMGSKK